jgi:hypothetical protein
MKTLFSVETLSARRPFFCAPLVPDGLSDLSQGDGAWLYDRFEDAPGP